MLSLLGTFGVRLRRWPRVALLASHALPQTHQPVALALARATGQPDKKL